MKFKRFTKRQFLHSIGRERLGQLFGRYTADIKAHGLAMPDPAESDDTYFTAIANFMLAPEGVPLELTEALFVIEEMATPQGQEQLETAAAATGLELRLGDTASSADIAVQAWLTNPELVVTQHKRMRISRLSSFDYYGSARSTNFSRRFSPPSQATLAVISQQLDTWFRQHHRGRGTTHVQMHELDAEYLFIICHGDTYARTVRINGGRIEPLHFRPAKDDMLIYTPRRDEIRIHAGTKGEKELYRRIFGLHLRGSENHFCQLMTYTLEPLRTDGRDALRPRSETGIKGIGLREVEIEWRKGYTHRVVQKSEDVFLCAMAQGKEAIPATGEIKRAKFDIQFSDGAKPRQIELRPPNTLKFGRHCDANPVHEWLTDRRFRIATAPDTTEEEVA